MSATAITHVGTVVVPVADHAALRGAAADADAELIRIDDVPPMFTFRDADGNRLRMVERE